jgi:hypothetical protein
MVVVLPHTQPRIRVAPSSRSSVLVPSRTSRVVVGGVAPSSCPDARLRPHVLATVVRLRSPCIFPSSPRYILPCAASCPPVAAMLAGVFRNLQDMPVLHFGGSDFGQGLTALQHHCCFSSSHGSDSHLSYCSRPRRPQWRRLSLLPLMRCVHTLLSHQHLLLSRMSSMASRLCSSHTACSSVASSSPTPAFPYTPTH